MGVVGASGLFDAADDSRLLGVRKTEVELDRVRSPDLGFVELAERDARDAACEFVDQGSPCERVVAVALPRLPIGPLACEPPASAECWM